MAGKNNAEKDHDQTLLALDQLSQTLDAMTVVVERLRRNLMRQALRDDAEQAAAGHGSEAARDKGDRRLVVEISQQELDDGTDPTLH